MEKVNLRVNLSPKFEELCLLWYPETKKKSKSEMAKLSRRELFNWSKLIREIKYLTEEAVCTVEDRNDMLAAEDYAHGKALLQKDLNRNIVAVKKAVRIAMAAKLTIETVNHIVLEIYQENKP